ncbi:hypothetical protein Theth_0090 [Pseudothermotoga thermarum DSM 5069]|uniref:Uncharacterized protein n=1 Tax=Pseudothermotoga thermarum DSM 5069 TaxID=688269 RepID=F7YU95_9THEM|nr:hypothetical protein Theth_0090 [Pseudothermotoga thermarum DSM 5069]
MFEKYLDKGVSATKLNTIIIIKKRNRPPVEWWLRFFA